MFAFDELETRTPEPTEVMSEYESIQYFKAKYKSNNQINPYDLVMTDINSKLNIRGKILDVGCGYGELIFTIKKNNPKLEIVGLDASKILLSFAKEINKKTKFIFSTANKLPFENDSFDFIICKDTFHHFKNPKKVLNEMYRVLKKGGAIYLIDLCRDADKKTILNVINELSKGNLTHTKSYIESVKAAYTQLELKKLFDELKIEKYSIKKGTNTPKINALVNRVSDSKKQKILLNFFKGRFVAIIKK